MKKGIDYVGISVITLLHDGEGNYLFGLRTNKCRDEHGRWDPAGSGALEHGETIEACAVREAVEEVGTKPFNLNFIGFREIFRDHHGKSDQWLSIDYLGEVDPTKVRIMEPDKCSELRWCKIDQIPEPMHSFFPAYLEKYKDIL